MINANIFRQRLQFIANIGPNEVKMIAFACGDTTCKLRTNGRPCAIDH